MEEIKFRAWDKLFKEMFDVPMLSNKAVFHATPQLKSVMPNGVPLNQVELMQYTGLKDKNGKEIYEGDIVKDKGDGHPYQVIFCYGSFDINWPHCCNHCAKGDASHGSLYEYLAFGEGAEVIGNIYENPGLLEGVKP